MLIVAISSFWIHDMRVWGPWSPIHLLSILVLVMLPLGVYFARIHRVRGHKLTMLGHLLRRARSLPASSRSFPAASCTAWCSAAERRSAIALAEQLTGKSPR